MSATKFKVGDTVYSLRGESAYYILQDEDGHIVRPFYDASRGDDEPREVLGLPEVWRKIFVEPPVATFSAELKSIHDQITKARADLLVAQVAHRDWQSLEKQRRAERDKFDQLRHIDDVIAGRITHFAMFSGYSKDRVSVVTFLQGMEQHEQYGRKSMRLLSLYGSKEEKTFCWSIHQYRTDSHSDSEFVVPCTSEEEAREVVRSYIAEKLASSARSLDGHTVTWAKLGDEWGVPVPAAVATKAAEITDAARQYAIENARKEHDKALARMSELGIGGVA